MSTGWSWSLPSRLRAAGRAREHPGRYPGPRPTPPKSRADTGGKVRHDGNTRGGKERRMAEGTSLDAPIVAVTVFRDGARVQRSGTVSVEPGLRPVVIGGLPASVDSASVRVAARGRDLALLNVEVHRRYR